MSRKTLITMHLYLAAFFTPIILVMAVTGGLYLLGVKGNIQYQTVATLENTVLDLGADNLSEQVSQLLQQSGLDADFEMVKVKGREAFTRPTHRQHYRLEVQDERVIIQTAEPDLQAGWMELHKGHGPAWFKQFERIFALGLIIIMLSGLYLGLSSKGLRRSTLMLSGSGLLVTLALTFL